MSTKMTVCPFCRNGCESGVSFDGYQHRMEYVAGAKVNQGRLCPRGNSASLVVDHPKRLAFPLLDGKETTWDKATGLIREWLGAVRPEAVAFVYGRGRTESEVRLILGFARRPGTANVVCGHIEPENSFCMRLDGTRNATLDDLRSARSMLLVGDVFSTSPVAAGPLVEARYADRKSRLVVVDSIRTRQSGFAHQFVQVRPGTEPFALMALAALLPGQAVGIDVDRFAGLAGVERSELEAAGQTLGSGTPGFVGSAMHLGRVRYPALHGLAVQLVAVRAGMPFIGFGEASLPPGPVSFGTFRQALAGGKIDMVLWFGGLYPYSYPEVFPEAGRARFRVATCIFRPESPVPGLLLPVTSELEQESIGQSYWGEVNRYPVATPYSGSRSVARLLMELGGALEHWEEPKLETSHEQLLVLANQAAGDKVEEVPEAGFTLVGEKKAIGIKGLYDPEDRILVSPADAVRLELTEGCRVEVETPTSRCEFTVHLSSAVRPGVLSVGVNVHQNRALFPIVVDPNTGGTSIPPASASVTKLSQASRPAMEKRAVEF